MFASRIPGGPNSTRTTFRCGGGQRSVGKGGVNCEGGEGQGKKGTQLMTSLVLVASSQDHDREKKNIGSPRPYAHMHDPVAARDIDDR